MGHGQILQRPVAKFTPHHGRVNPTLFKIGDFFVQLGRAHNLVGGVSSDPAISNADSHQAYLDAGRLR